MCKHSRKSCICLNHCICVISTATQQPSMQMDQAILLIVNRRPFLHRLKSQGGSSAISLSYKVLQRLVIRSSLACISDLAPASAF
jgi:hypothetical protein